MIWVGLLEESLPNRVLEAIPDHNMIKNWNLVFDDPMLTDPTKYRVRLGQYIGLISNSTLQSLAQSDRE
jgi:hypothetical protein